MSATSSRWRVVASCAAITTFATIAYGIAHDQITARISLEYFTIAHVQLFLRPTPTLMGFVWGILATWWVGLLAGIALGLASTLRSPPPHPPVRLWRLLLGVFAATAAAELVVGSATRALFVSGIVALPEPWATRIEPERQADFIAVAAAHTCGYALAAVGTVVLCVVIWRRRSRPPG